MDVVSQDNSGASVRFTYDELAIVYGALVEAMEALSHEEFSARVGRSEVEAERLRNQLKPVLIAMDPRDL